MNLTLGLAVRAVRALPLFRTGASLRAHVVSDGVVVGDEMRGYRVTPFLPDLVRVKFDAGLVARSRIVAVGPGDQTYDVGEAAGLALFLDTHHDFPAVHVAQLVVEALTFPDLTEQPVSQSQTGDLLRPEDVQSYGVSEMSEEALPKRGRRLKFWSAGWQTDGHSGRALTLRRWTVELPATAGATWEVEDIARGLPIPRYSSLPDDPH